MVENPENLKKIIRDAFEGINNIGISVREAIALDDCADEKERQSARLDDKEEKHWWDIAEEWRPSLGNALSFTDVEGFRFLLPAAIMAELDGVDRDNGHSVFFHLVLINKASNIRPHHGYPEYINFLKNISAQENAEYYGLDSTQIQAVAKFFNWYMQSKSSHLYSDRIKELRVRTRLNQQFLERVPRDHYSLSLDDEMNIFDQECRILQDWLELGNVQIVAER
jgi:hypothetical protein